MIDDATAWYERGAVFQQVREGASLEARADERRPPRPPSRDRALPAAGGASMDPVGAEPGYAEAPSRSAANQAASSHLLLLVPAGRTDATPLLARLSDDVHVTVLGDDRLDPRLPPVDVAVLHAEQLGLVCSPLLHDRDVGLPELVFVVEETSSPQAFALRSRGFRHVVAAQDLPDWLPSALARLVSLARARRLLLGACGEDPGAIEPLSTIRHHRPLRLHAAETSFRTAFMRALLAEHGSRRRAAEAAGVPYRSFCEMLRKLGIPG